MICPASADWLLMDQVVTDHAIGGNMAVGQDDIVRGRAPVNSPSLVAEWTVTSLAKHVAVAHAQGPDSRPENFKIVRLRADRRVRKTPRIADRAGCRPSDRGMMVHDRAVADHRRAPT